MTPLGLGSLPEKATACSVCHDNYRLRIWGDSNDYFMVVLYTKVRTRSLGKPGLCSNLLGGE